MERGKGRFHSQSPVKARLGGNKSILKAIRRAIKKPANQKINGLFKIFSFV